MTQDEAWLLKEKYNGEKTDDFLSDCDRLKAGEPLAYLIGSIPFLNTTIFLDSHPLIPRTETEFWVEKMINDMKQHEGVPLHILDLCAGSGCIGVAILKHIPHATVDFVEVDNSHHETIKKNISENGIDPSRTHIYGGNLFENISGTYDYILTNPPYIDPEQNQTEESVKKYEPRLALYAEHEGLEIIYKIVSEAPRFLNTEGVLVIEHDPEQSEKIRTYALHHHLTTKTHLDQFDVERYMTATLSIQ